MCQTISGIAVKTGDTVMVYMSKKSDSHSDIRQEYKIRDDNSPIAGRQTPVELIPVTSLTDIDGMKFKFDDVKPDWWTDDMTEEAIRQLYQALNRRWDKSKTVFSFPGDLDLGNLVSIPEGVTLKAGGSLDLSSLISIPSIPEGVTLEAGGSLDLSSLVSIPSIPEGVMLKAGGSLYLSSLVSIPEGVIVTAGHIFLKGE